MVVVEVRDNEIHQKNKKHSLNMSKRSKPLHNFSLPTLKWGHQRYLRCMKVNSKGEIVSSSDLRSSGSEGDFDEKDLKLGKQRSLNSLPQSSRDGIEESRPKLMVHLHTATDKTKKLSIPDENQEDESRVASAVRPWNLRTRRAACKEPNETGGGSSKLDERQSHQQHRNISPQKSENPSPKSLRLRGLAATAANQGMEKKERRTFSRSLNRDEIKDDYLMMTGNNLPRRPKKRAKIVQKQLDSLLPGFWLTEVTTDTYRLPDELVETKK